MSRYMFTYNFIKLSAAIHKLLCPQTFLPYLAMVKKPMKTILSVTTMNSKNGSLSDDKLSNILTRVLGVVGSFMIILLQLFQRFCQ